MSSRPQTSRPRRTALASALALAAVLGSGAARGVVLDDENQVSITLNDGTTVVLYGEADTSLAGPPSGPPPNVQEMAERALGRPDSPLSEPRTTTGSESAQGSPASRLLATKITALSRLQVQQYVKSTKFYYLPPGLHLSKRPDGTPEFLFLKFTTEASEAQGGVSGALMHFLVEWGLTPEQENELRSKLKSKVPNSQFMGAVPMEPEGETGSFEIVSATLSDKTMAPSVVTSGKAPLVPGGKAAVASRLSANGAQLLAATFEKARSITDVSLAVNLAYTTLTPAAKGSITFNWQKLEAERDKLQAEYKKEYARTDNETDCFLFFCFSDDETQYNYTYNQLQEQYKFLEEKQIVHLEWMETRNDEKLNKIREAFFDYFVQSMANPVDIAATAQPEEGKSDPGAPVAPEIPQNAASYKYDRQAVQAAFKRKISYFDLNVRLPVRHPLQVVGNLGSWYDAVENNPKCVASVNLNDPFFQHRDIHFILDLDAKEMFDQAVNYVTVNVRKKRDAGNPFEDHITMDAKYLQEKGINASVTYARGEDKNPDVYEYQSQWSLRGGVLYPKDPPWQRGRWEGVTLAPPLVPRTIEVEGGLEDMSANQITRITVQIHYPKFGQEVEENIAVSPVQGQALVAKKIFMDRDARGYAYRLIVNHKTEGKLVLPWSARVGDDYIYATIPDDLLAEGSSLKTEAKEAAKDLVNSAKERVLDRFKELVGGGGS
jgi:hypothetical protein